MSSVTKVEAWEDSEGKLHPTKLGAEQASAFAAMHKKLDTYLDDDGCAVWAHAVDGIAGDRELCKLVANYLTLTIAWRDEWEAKNGVKLP